MKKLLLPAILLLCFSALGQTQQPEKQDTLIISHSKAEQLKQVLGFAYSWLPKSKAPSDDVQTILPVIQDLYLALWPIAPARKEDKNKPKTGGK